MQSIHGKARILLDFPGLAVLRIEDMPKVMRQLAVPWSEV